MESREKVEFLGVSVERAMVYLLVQINMKNSQAEQLNMYDPYLYYDEQP